MNDRQMPSHPAVNQDAVLDLAQTLSSSSTSECQEIFADLLRKKQLSQMVFRLNQLLDDKEHSAVARSGLCRLGFPDDIKDVP